MSKEEVVTAVVTAVGLTKVQAQAAVDAALAEIVRRTVTQGEFRVGGFGTFLVVEHAGLTVKAPVGDETYQVPPRRLVKFRPSRAFGMAAVRRGPNNGSVHRPKSRKGKTTVHRNSEV